MADMDRIGEQIRAAYVDADLTAFGELLAGDVRWGDDDHPNRCRNRDDVIRTFTQWTTSGVTADVVGVTTGASGVLCRLHVTWTDPNDRARGVDFIHAFLVRDGLIAEIRRYDNEKAAAKAIA